MFDLNVIRLAAAREQKIRRIVLARQLAHRNNTSSSASKGLTDRAMVAQLVAAVALALAITIAVASAASTHEREVRLEPPYRNQTNTLDVSQTQPTFD
jgi:hypothetical protein